MGLIRAGRPGLCIAILAMLVLAAGAEALERHHEMTTDLEELALSLLPGGHNTHQQGHKKGSTDKPHTSGNTGGKGRHLSKESEENHDAGSSGSQIADAKETLSHTTELLEKKRDAPASSETGKADARQDSGASEAHGDSKENSEGADKPEVQGRRKAQTTGAGSNNGRRGSRRIHHRDDNMPNATNGDESADSKMAELSHHHRKVVVEQSAAERVKEMSVAERIREIGKGDGTVHKVDLADPVSHHTQMLRASLGRGKGRAGIRSHEVDLSESAASAAADPVAADPVAADPVAADPAAADPAAADPAAAEPAAADPAAAEPAVADPAVAEPAVAEPAVAEPAVADPAPVDPAPAVVDPAVEQDAAALAAAQAAQAVAEQKLAQEEALVDANKDALTEEQKAHAAAEKAKAEAEAAAAKLAQEKAAIQQQADLAQGNNAQTAEALAAEQLAHKNDLARDAASIQAAEAAKEQMDANNKRIEEELTTKQNDLNKRLDTVGNSLTDSKVAFEGLKSGMVDMTPVQTELRKLKLAGQMAEQSVKATQDVSDDNTRRLDEFVKTQKRDSDHRVEDLENLKNNDFDDRITAFDTQLSALEAAQGDMNGVLNAAKTKADLLQNQLFTISGEMKDQTSSAKNEASMLSAKVDTLGDASGAEVNEVRRSIDEARKEAMRMRDMQKSNLADISRIESSISKSKLDLQTLQGAAGKMKNDVQASLEERERRFKTLEGDTTDLKKKLDGLTKAEKTHMNNINLIQRLQNERSMRVGVLSDETVDSQKRLERLNANMKDFNGRLDVVKVKEKEINKHVALSFDKIERLEAGQQVQKRKFSSSVAELESGYDSVKESNTRSEKFLANIEEKDHKQELSMAGRDEANLKKRVMDDFSFIKRAEHTQYSEYKRKAQDLDTKVDRPINYLKDVISRLVKENVNLKKEVHDREEEIRKNAERDIQERVQKVLHQNNKIRERYKTDWKEIMFEVNKSRKMEQQLYSDVAEIKKLKTDQLADRVKFESLSKSFDMKYLNMLSEKVDRMEKLYSYFDKILPYIRVKKAGDTSAELPGDTDWMNQAKKQKK